MPIPAVALLLSLATADVAGPESPPPLRIDERTAYLDIDAADLETAVAIIRGQQDQPGVGRVRVHTQSELHVSYRLVPAESGCRIEDIALVLDVTMRVPRWAPPDPVRPRIREQWERMNVGMHVHERGHRDNAVAMAQETLQRLQALAVDAPRDCAAAGRRIMRERFAAQVRYQSRDEAYDRRTRHGLTQAPPPEEVQDERRAQR